MTILKVVPKERRSLDEMIKYMTQPAKTHAPLILSSDFAGSLFASCVNLSQEAWQQGERSPYIQIILSFDTKTSMERSLSTLIEVCRRVENVLCPPDSSHVIFGVIHTNTDNIHCHYLIGRTNFTTGQRYRQGKSLFSYKQEVNRILTQYNLPQIHCFQGHTYEGGKVND